MPSHSAARVARVWRIQDNEAPTHRSTTRPVLFPVRHNVPVNKEFRRLLAAGPPELSAPPRADEHALTGYGMYVRLGVRRFIAAFERRSGRNPERWPSVPCRFFGETAAAKAGQPRSSGVVLKAAMNCRTPNDVAASEVLNCRSDRRYAGEGFNARKGRFGRENGFCSSAQRPLTHDLR